MPYYDDDGNELNPNLIAKPSLCVACASDDSEDEMERVLCNLTRLDQQEDDAFTCHAYTPKTELHVRPQRFISMTRPTLWILLGTLVLGTLAVAQTSYEAQGQQLPSTPHSHSHSAPGELPMPHPDRIALTWAENPATSLSVTWRTDTTVAAAQAQVAPAKAEPSFFTRSDTAEAETERLDLSPIEGEHVNAHYHSVTLSGLKPNTLYAYRVGDGTRWSEWFHARTASDQPDAMSFLYFGDVQNNIRSHWSRAIRAAYRHAPDARFMIHAGDLVNSAHRNIEWGQWHQAGGFIQSMLPSVPVPGNHEYDAFEKWMEKETFAISAALSESKMEGIVTEPDGDSEPLVATYESDAAGSEADYPAGSWKYRVDEDDDRGTLRIEKQSDGFGGTLVSESSSEYPLQNVTADRDTFSAEFAMEVEKEGPDHLSAHWRPGFTLPTNGPDGFEESTYFLDIQGVRVIGLNSEPATEDTAALKAQTAWLDSVLTNNPSRWTVVTFHHPLFSSSEGRENPGLRSAWKPLFDKHRVDLVLQGHDHTYARGRAKNLAQGVNARSPVGGTVYVNSVSGAKMYEIKPERWTDYESIEMERSAENTQLFQVIRVAGDTLHFRAYTAVGELYDAFKLAKRSGDKPNRFILLTPSGAAERTHENTIPYERY